jgi:hypothetical protein
VPLSSDEFDAIVHLIGPLPPHRRDEFLAAVEAALQGRMHGPGIVHRTAVSLLPRYFHPPEPTHRPLHFHPRKLAATR